MMDKKTVLIVDAHPLFRKALVSLAEEVCTCALSAASAEEALRIAAETPLNLIVLDVEDAAGVEVMRQFRRSSAAAILVVTASQEPQVLVAATNAGAAAVVSKRVSVESLKIALVRGLSGSFQQREEDFAQEAMVPHHQRTTSTSKPRRS